MHDPPMQHDVPLFGPSKHRPLRAACEQLCVLLVPDDELEELDDVPLVPPLEPPPSPDEHEKKAAIDTTKHDDFRTFMHSSDLWPPPRHEVAR